MQGCNLRFGHVTEYDPSRHMARVNFPDIGLTSWWLPVLTANTLKNHDTTHLDIGEHVACMMSGQGAEMGVILGAFYDDKNKPLIKNPDIRSVTFDDGTQIIYDRKEHELEITGPEHISITAENITLIGKISVADNITLSGNIALSDNITLSGNITLDGSVSCPGYCHC